MKDKQTIENSNEKKGTIETSVYCMNTRRKYIYEIRDGEIISERVVQETG